MIPIFDRFNFYPKKDNLDISKIIFFLKDQIVQNIIKYDHKFNDISSMLNPKENTIIFVNDPIFLNDYIDQNNLIITDNKNIFKFNKFENIILVKNIDLSYLRIVNHLLTHEDNADYYDEFVEYNKSFISKFAQLDENVKLQNNCTICRGVKIGSNSIIKNNVIIKSSIIGKYVNIGDNTVIGSTGFGFNLDNFGSLDLIPQIGIVYIQDNVRIGSNCNIDRGRIDTTFIGKNSMLDNQIHIAHNVTIGENACIAAQVGIAGSAKIGNNFMIGGQSGIAGHVVLGDFVVVAGRSGVTKNIRSNSRVAGFPAIDINQWKKNIISQKKNGYK